MTPIVAPNGIVSMPEGPIIITSGPLVGLGDIAVYSTLAKRFAELGREVYVDRDNRARNDEIFDLFWRMNPHVIGPTDRKPNAGYVRQGLFYEIANRFPCGAIEAMERAHGLPPPYSIAPWTAYVPKAFPHDVRGQVLVDFSAVSSHIADPGIAEFYAAMQWRFKGRTFLQLLMPKWASLAPARVALQSIAIDSVYEYLDALSACHAWIGSEAGGQSLAASVRGEHRVNEFGETPHVAVCATPKTFNSRGYVYAGVDYRVSQFCADKDGDFWKPHEVVVHNYELQCAASHAQMRALA